MKVLVQFSVGLTADEFIFDFLCKAAGKLNRLLFLFPHSPRCE